MNWKFASLISYISAKTGQELDPWDIEDIEGRINDMHLTKKAVDDDQSQCIADMLQAMAENRKIDAIKALREAVGYEHYLFGLKEAKDAIEAAMSPKGNI